MQILKNKTKQNKNANIELAKKFIWVFLYHLTEEPR